MENHQMIQIGVANAGQMLPKKCEIIFHGKLSECTVDHHHHHHKLLCTALNSCMLLMKGSLSLSPSISNKKKKTTHCANVIIFYFGFNGFKFIEFNGFKSIR